MCGFISPESLSQKTQCHRKLVMHKMLEYPHLQVIKVYELSTLFSPFCLLAHYKLLHHLLKDVASKSR